MNTTTQKTLTLNLDTFAYNTYFIDRQYGLDPFWEEDLYDQDKLKYKDTYNKPNNQIESGNLTMDAHVSDALRYELIYVWTVNPHLPDTSSLPNIRPRPQNQQRQNAVTGDQLFPQLQVTPDGLTRLLLLSTNLPLKSKLEMLYFLMDIKELNIDGLIHTGFFVRRRSGSQFRRNSITGSTYNIKSRPST